MLKLFFTLCCTFSHIARTNLIQLGKLLQTLAILPYEEAPSTFSDLIPHFKQVQPFGHWSRTFVDW